MSQPDSPDRDRRPDRVTVHRPRPRRCDRGIPQGSRRDLGACHRRRVSARSAGRCCSRRSPGVLGRSRDRDRLALRAASRHRRSTGPPRTSPSPAVAIVLVGASYIGVLSGLNTVVQIHAPPAARGRILGLYMLALGTIYPIGALAPGTDRRPRRDPRRHDRSRDRPPRYDDPAGCRFGSRDCCAASPMPMTTR